MDFRDVVVIWFEFLFNVFFDRFKIFEIFVEFI